MIMRRLGTLSGAFRVTLSRKALEDLRRMSPRCAAQIRPPKSRTQGNRIVAEPGLTRAPPKQQGKQTMKIINSAVLGSVACLVAIGGAQAADFRSRPRRSNTSGSARSMEMAFTSSRAPTPASSSAVTCAPISPSTAAVFRPPRPGAARQVKKNQLSNYYFARARENLNVDTRTATEYGVVRTFFDANFSWTTGTYASTGGGGTVYSAAAQERWRWRRRQPL